MPTPATTLSMPNSRKDLRKELRLGADDVAQIELGARALDQSLSEFMRQAAIERAQSLQAQSQQTVLESHYFKQFAAAVHATDVTPTQGLIDLLDPSKRLARRDD